MIFEDKTRKRWKWTALAFAVLTLSASAILVVWIDSLVSSPSLPGITGLKDDRTSDYGERGLKTRRASHAPASEGHPALKKSTQVYVQGKGPDSFIDLHRLAKGEHLSTAFMIQGDEASIRSFKEHSASIDMVFPDWYFLTRSKCDIDEREEPDITALLKAGRVAVVPRITNADKGEWHVQELQKVLKDPGLRECTVAALAGLLKKAGVEGVNIDFEGLEAGDSEGFLDFLAALSKILHAQNQFLTVDVPVDEPAFNLDLIGKAADAVVIMAYDQHYAGGEPGPISGYDWFDKAVDTVKGDVDPGKIIVALGSYGYDWPVVKPPKPAQSLRFDKVMSLAQEVGAVPQMDDVARNMMFSYLDSGRVKHEVWFLNGVTVWNQWHLLSGKGVLGTSLWRLGIEDPAVWNVLGNSHPDAGKMTVSPPLSSIDYQSQGELFHLRYSPAPGKLELVWGSDGSIENAGYVSVPAGYVVERAGKAMTPGDLVLTFDDGPDEVWTPQILDVLSRRHVPAVFFILGEQGEKHPELLKRMKDQGVFVGNHTYHHPNISGISEERLKLELNSTQRVIELEYGSKTMLFRAPYDTDSSPSTLEQFRPIGTASNSGYIIAGANIDSGDWKRPGVDEIIRNVEKGLRDPSNHIIVMHDSGGDRSQTVAALDRMIPYLQKLGYRFVGLDMASGLGRKTLLPPLDARERLFSRVDRFIYVVRHWGWHAIVWLFFITTGISILRILFLGSLVLLSARRGRGAYGGDVSETFISIVVPAHNEETTIGKTLRTLQTSIHKRYEVIVVDDGSTDGTAVVVRNIMNDDPRISFISKPNGGKSSALNLGFEKAGSDIVVTIDADTILYPFTLTELVKPFSDETVDAVCGNVEVGNARNILTGFQALEYITTQNFDRRAFEALNCISVVPGATGAWRRNKVLDLGGYTNDTLTEDADLTLRLLMVGGKIVYAANARSRTEAPETLRNLIKQRFRWSFGTFQCLYKHRRAFFKGTLGWVALPNMLLFQVVFPVLSPVGDAVFLMSLILGSYKAIMTGYVLFLLMDLGGSLLAFTLEKRPKALMWLILIQRFFYRQFMYVVTFISIIAIFRGRRHGWNKINRTGSIRILNQ